MGDGIKKTPSGIQGLDEITCGGLPQGRPTLICGAAGCGKTLMSVEFLVRGATQYGEPGVLMAFEETAKEIAVNVQSLGFDLKKLVDEKKLIVDHVRIERSEIEETGDYDLEGLFVRLGHAIDSIGAKRVVLDTLESIFSGLSDTAILRAELRRLFQWLKERGVTAIITAEKGEGTLTRYGMEEYVSDCVIVLDHRVTEQVSTRRLRIVKYRGSIHGTNEFPFLIDANGISVLPITSAKLEHEAPSERVSTGNPGLDEMLGGKGYFKGASVLVSGTAGTGKTTIAAHFAASICANNGRCLYFAFEESPKQLIRNMRSAGIDLQPAVDNGRLLISSARPSLHGLEMHLALILKAIRDFRPDGVVIDPTSNFIAAGTCGEAGLMLTRLVDFLKSQAITSVFTCLMSGVVAHEHASGGISSIIDTWLFVRDLEIRAERVRGIYVLKSRGMAHSNKVRQFSIGDNGVKIADWARDSEKVRPFVETGV